MIFSVGADADREGRFHHLNAVAAQSPVRGLLLRLLIAPAMLSLSLLAGCKTPVEKAAVYAEQAQERADAGDRLGAMEAIQKAIAERDDKADYFLLLSSIQMRAGNVAEAYNAAKRALELDSANTNALRIVANVGLQVGAIDDANEAADRLLSLDPGSLNGLQVKGLIALYRNKLDEAQRYAQQLLTLSPTDEAGTIIQARVLAKTGKFEEALALIDRNLTQGNPSAALLVTKINLYRVLGRPEDMAKTYDRLETVLADQPPSIQLDRINLLYKLGKTAEARAATSKLLGSNVVDDNNIAVLQRIWTEFDRVPFTHETVKQAKAWKDPVVLLGVGRYLLWQGQPQLADDLYFAFPAALRPVGIALHQRAQLGIGFAERARAGTAAILERDREDADGLLLESQFLAQAGKLGLAIEGVQKALDADPNDPELYIALANLHARSGANWRAAQIFEDGLKQLPQNFLLIERYTQFLHESGNKSRAVSASRAFARAVPSSVRAWTIMAQQCAWAADAACASEAADGRQKAATRYLVDDPPGKPEDRSLLGKF